MRMELELERGIKVDVVVVVVVSVEVNAWDKSDEKSKSVSFSQFVAASDEPIQSTG